MTKITKQGNDTLQINLSKWNNLKKMITLVAKKSI